MDFFGDNYVRGFITDDNGQLWNTGTKEELDKWEQDNRDKARIYYDENDDVGHPLSWQFPVHPNIDYEDLAAKPDSMYEMPYANDDVPIYKFRYPGYPEDSYLIRDTVLPDFSVDPSSIVAWNGMSHVEPETTGSLISKLKQAIAGIVREVADLDAKWTDINAKVINGYKEVTFLKERLAGRTLDEIPDMYKHCLDINAPENQDSLFLDNNGWRYVGLLRDGEEPAQTDIITGIKQREAFVKEKAAEVNEIEEDVKVKRAELKDLRELLNTVVDFASISDYDIAKNGLIEDAGKFYIEGTQTIYPDVGKIQDVINSKRHGNILNGIATPGGN